MDACSYIHEAWDTDHLQMAPFWMVDVTEYFGRLDFGGQRVDLSHTERNYILIHPSEQATL